MAETKEMLIGSVTYSCITSSSNSVALNNNKIVLSLTVFAGQLFSGAQQTVRSLMGQAVSWLLVGDCLVGTFMRGFFTWPRLPYNMVAGV